MNPYQRNLCYEAHQALFKAGKAMREADHNLFCVEGAEFEHDIYVSVLGQIEALSQSYYAKSRESAK